MHSRQWPSEKTLQHSQANTGADQHDYTRGNTLEPSSSKALKNETMSSFLWRIALTSGGSSMRLSHTMMKKQSGDCSYVVMHCIYVLGNSKGSFGAERVKLLHQ